MRAPPLLLSRRFAPLFCCQFFAAFNDNFLKTALVFLILFRVGHADAPALITAASAIFIAPYFFLSGLGGELADRYDKARVAQWVKFVEIFVAALAVLGYARQSLPLLFTALNNQFWSTDLLQPMANLPVVIFQFAMSPYNEWHALAWAGSLLITLSVLGLSIIARTLLRKVRMEQ